jgi:two-component system, OmpR family, KDP operon response regulator KdpE
VPESPDPADRPLVLLVDDDTDILTSLRLHLRADGYQVVTAASVAEGNRLVQERLPHVAVVDLMLPDGTGLQVARSLRHLAAVPIIILTAVDDEDNKVEKLQDLADDYVTKPFSARELSARIASVLRRAWPSGHPSAATLQLHNGVEVDFMRRRISRREQVLHLTPTESRLLWLLVSHAGQVLSAQTLLARVWTEGEGSSASLWEYIRRLREKLGDHPSQPQYIVTERDLGYRFEINDRPGTARTGAPSTAD